MTEPNCLTKAATQMELFATRPVAPLWRELPEGVRENAAAELAKLILHHARARQSEEEANDER